MFQPVIKWSGSKRSQAKEIVSYFPDNIDTYYEPFVGGGSIMFKLLNSNKKFNSIICSDLNNDLIDLWNMIKYSKEELSEGYERLWLELNKDDNIVRKKEFYNFIRGKFNKYRNPIDFMFINRTTTNGLIRYNKKGEFNNSFHFNRKGINPKTLQKIIYHWSDKINEFNVEFITQDYQNITTNKRDFVYCDPPYMKTKGMYYGTIDYDRFFEWLINLEAKYCFSFDGKVGEEDLTAPVPKEVYERHLYIKSGCSSFRRIKEQKIEYVYESLYLSY